MTIEALDRSVPYGLKLRYELSEHRNWIGRSAFSPDGTKFATPSSDSTVGIWDCSTDPVKCREVLRRHSEPVKAVAWAADGSVLASAGEDCCVWIWDSVDWQPVRELSVDEPVLSVAFGLFDSSLWIASGRKLLTMRDWRSDDEWQLVAHHQGRVTNIAGGTSVDEEALIASCSDRGELRLWMAEPETETLLQGQGGPLYSLALAPNGRLLATAGRDGIIQLWNPKSLHETGRRLREIDAHQASIRSLSFSSDGRILASSSLDETVKIWDCDSWREVAILAEPPSRSRVWFPGLSFHPSRPWLATLGNHDRNIRLWELDQETLVGVPSSHDVRYLTAKVVLVGDSGVGKTALGQRLARGEFREQPSSHGQHFWVIDSLRTTLRGETECEVVLWDLAGQPDYRLVHTLFLDRVDIALVVFDPTEQERPLKGVDYWLNALREGTGRRCEVILVAARTDRGIGTLTDDEIERYCVSRQIAAYVATSAFTGDGLQQLTDRLREVLNWDDRSPGPTSAAFTQVKRHVFTLRDHPILRDGSPLMEIDELIDRLLAIGSQGYFDRHELRQAIEELEIYGHILLLRGRNGQEIVLTEPDLLGRLASSVVLHARASVKGLGSLEEKRFLGGHYDLPELRQLSEPDRRTMLDAVATTFIERNLCLRETLGGDKILLIFPALINVQKPAFDDHSIIDDATYVVQGPVDRVFAALVVLLGYAQTITRVDQWHKGAQYEIESDEDEVCGFRVLNEHEGRSEFVLYFGKATREATRMMFQGLFETFLARWEDVDFIRYPVIACPQCQFLLDRNVVVRRLRTGKPSAFCEECGTRLKLPKVVETELREPSGPVAAGERSALSRTVYERALVGLKRLVLSRGETALRPVCFLSCEPSRTRHAGWIRRLEADLRNAEIDVLIREQSIVGPRPVTDSHFILVCGTPAYAEACRSGGDLAAEWASIEGLLTDSGNTDTQVVPLLFSGKRDFSFPASLGKREVLDLRDGSGQLCSLFDLMLRLHQISVDSPEVRDLRRDLRRPVELLRAESED